MKLISTKQAAAILSVSAPTVLKFDIPYVDLTTGKRKIRKYVEADVLAFIDRQKVQGSKPWVSTKRKAPKSTTTSSCSRVSDFEALLAVPIRGRRKCLSEAVGQKSRACAKPKT